MGGQMTKEAKQQNSVAEKNSEKRRHVDDDDDGFYLPQGDCESLA